MSTPTDAAAVVVGVGPGLGGALVATFADAGYTVFAAARRASKLGGLQRPDGRAIAVDCDATDPAEVERLFEQVEARGLPLAVAIYNAGVFAPGRVADIEPADFERCWRAGCFGGFLVGRAAARRMLERGEGTILFTGATASLRGGAGFANLASPKFALRAVAQSMARELGPAGIHVAHVIIDGQIRAERFEHLREQRGPDSLLEPAAIAEAYLALHRQHRSAWTDEVPLRPWVEKF
jgi:NAD(P)-dependent dehydrogenase (short-subunit alcohol dehydrogenase family)